MPTFDLFVRNILQQWMKFSEQILSCTTLTLWTDRSLASLRAKVSGNILIPCNYYVTKVAFATSPISTFFSKTRFSFRVNNLSKLLGTWWGIWEIEKNRVLCVFPGTCSNCEKHCFTIWTGSVSRTLIKPFSRTWQYLALNKFVCKGTNSLIPMLQFRLASLFQLLYPFHPNCLKNQTFSSIQVQDFGWILCWCSQWVCSTEQSSDKIEVSGV